MFGGIFVKKSNENEESNNKIISNSDNNISLDFEADVGGCKGWFKNTCTVIYHSHQALICIGTVSGGVCVYGSDFQLFKSVNTASEVKCLSAIYPNQLFVILSDNSLILYSLPQLNIIQQLDSSWIGKSSGNISCIHVDDIAQMPYIYLGTTEGDFYVIHATDTSLRICDYTLTSAQVGVIDKDMILTDIHICPKDERYIALSYEGPNDDIGSVVIFDLKKKLPFKQYRTTAITSLAWNHTGDFLYAGTRIGELLSMTIEKSPSTIYNTNSELINTEDLPIAIRKILWLGPQVITQSGCLFILLDNDENTNIKNCIIGLANITNKPGEMSQVFALPPLINEYILGFRLIPLIPTAESSKSMQLASLSIDSNDNTSYHPLLIPGLLLLTEVKENNVTTRHLKVQSCPATNISNWPLSIGQLDPMEKVIPVLGSNSLFTTIVGITPTSNLSFGNIVIQLTQRGIDFTNRLFIKSKYDYNDYNQSTADNADFNIVNLSRFEFVLSKGIIDSTNEVLSNNNKDILFVGQTNGYVTVYLVYTTINHTVQLFAIKCSDSPITYITTDENSPLVAIADSNGYIYLWEVFNNTLGNEFGYVDSQKKSYKKKSHNRHNKEELLDILSKQDFIDDDEDDDASEESEEEEDNNDNYIPIFQPNDIRYNQKINVPDQITYLTIISEINIIVIGTNNGGIYIWYILKDSPNDLRRIRHQHLGTSGSVIGLFYSTYYNESVINNSASNATINSTTSNTSAIVPAIYVILSGGYVLIIHPFTLEILAHSIAFSPFVTQSPSSNKSSVDFDEEDNDDTGTHTIIPFHLFLDSNDNKFNNPLDSNETMNNYYFNENIQLNEKKLNSQVSNRRTSSLLQFFSRTNDDEITIRNRSKSRSNSFIDVNNNPTTTSNHQSTNNINLLDIPNSLMFIYINKLITIDIYKFIQLNVNPTNKRTSSSITNNKYNYSGISTVKELNTSTILSGKLVSYIDKDKRGFSDPIACVLCMNKDGILVTIRLTDKTILSQVDLYEHVFDICNITSTSILVNSHCYIISDDQSVICYNKPYHNQYINTIATSLSSKTNKTISYSNQWTDYQLISGRERLINDRMNALKKKRTSIINKLIKVTDLHKIFNKSKSLTITDDDDNDDDEPSSNTTTNLGINSTSSKTNNLNSTANNTLFNNTTGNNATGNNTTNVKIALNQTMEGLVERGEKLKNVENQSNELLNNAMNYKESITKHTEKLKKRNTTWGLF